MLITLFYIYYEYAAKITYLKVEKTHIIAFRHRSSSTGHHPAGSEIDASIIYADYYYIEALGRAK